MNRVTVFLSHSSKDIEKVRQIRNILEALDYEPLLFHLKCLDDDNDNLENFIEKEIEARNIFIYCKSQHSENSKWVQKELEYIKSFDSKRLFTIDITLSFKDTVVQLLQSIADIIKKNRIFLSCSHGAPDKQFGDYLEKLLTEHNYEVIRYKVLDCAKDDEHKIALQEANTFIAVISPNSVASPYCKSELDHVLYNYENSPSTFTNKIIPIYYNINSVLLLKLGILPTSLNSFQGMDISAQDSMTSEEEKFLLELLHNK